MGTRISFKERYERLYKEYKKELVDLYEQGYSMAEIGTMYGISAQGVNNVLKRPRE